MTTKKVLANILAGFAILVAGITLATLCLNIFISTPFGKTMEWNKLLASIGRNCATRNLQCRLIDINDLAMRGYDLRSKQEIRTAQLTLLHQLWQPTGTYADSDYVALINEARLLEDSTMMHDLCARYFYPAPSSTQAALQRYNQIRPEYYSEDDWMQPWAELTNERAIELIRTWDDCRALQHNFWLSQVQKDSITDKTITLANTWAQCDTVLEEYNLSASQADRILAKSAQMAEGQPLNAWWQIWDTATNDRNEENKEQWQGFNNRWALIAADKIISQTTELSDLTALASNANNRQILAMVLRLNTWPKLTPEDVLEWIGQLKDQSLASRILQDQVTRHHHSNGELVDAYNELEDTPMKNWIIDILRQRNPSMDQWNEIYLRSKEGSRLMTLAAIGSLRCDQ